MEIAHLPATHGFEEVAHVLHGIVAVTLLGLGAFARLVGVAQVDLESVVIHGHIPFVAVEDVPDRIAAAQSLSGWSLKSHIGFGVRRQSAHFENQFGVAVIERRNLRVRGFLVVLVDVLAARR